MKTGVGNGRSWGRRARHAAIRRAFWLPAVLGLALLAAPLRGQDPPPRRITVELAIDRGIADRAEWRVAAARLLDDCFRAFGRWFPLELRLDDVVTWSPDPGRKSLIERLGELRRKVRRGSCDIILGVMAPERTNAVSLGIASYPRADILVKNMASREAMTYAVLHELCHVFGAVDIQEKGSIMGLEEPGFSVDDFTGQAVRLNAGRSFDRRSSALPAPALDGAVCLFEGRALRGRREPQVQLFLTLLYLEKNDLEGAARACAAAAESDPGFPGLHNLMGNIRLFRGDYDGALAEYEKALISQPYEPGIHFNIGLAYVHKGLLDESIMAYRAALREDPGYAEAKQALALVLAAGRDVEAAKAAVEPFLLALRKVR